MITRERPAIFVGSSTEGLPIVEAIQVNLERPFEIVPWTAIFEPSEYCLESLDKKIGEFEASIFVITGDDVVRSRGTKKLSPRDNVLLEIGVSIGKLGKDRTILLRDRSLDIKLPSDLEGLNSVSFEPPTKGTWESSLGAACSRIRRKIQKLREGVA